MRANVQKMVDDARAHLSTESGRREWTARRRMGMKDPQNWAITVIKAGNGVPFTGESIDAAVKRLQGGGKC